ncbi:unnamed protein product [Colias eurytheme]|nr:unnamed protein product [Colias eurytheme]
MPYHLPCAMEVQWLRKPQRKPSQYSFGLGEAPVIDKFPFYRPLALHPAPNDQRPSFEPNAWLNGHPAKL